MSLSHATPEAARVGYDEIGTRRGCGIPVTLQIWVATQTMRRALPRRHGHHRQGSDVLGFRFSGTLFHARRSSSDTRCDRVEQADLDDRPTSSPPIQRRTAVVRSVLDGRRDMWESRWSKPAFEPLWAGRGVPPEVEEAIAACGSAHAVRILDIGCGEGDLAAWCAGHGHQSLGIDIAAAAVAKARSRHADVIGPLRSEALDICDAVPAGGPFDIIIDRGCLHGIPRSLHSRYLANVRSASHEGTRMLLFMRVWRGRGPLAQLTRARRLELWFHRRRVTALFRGCFTIERAGMTDLRGSATAGEMPGVVYHLARWPMSDLPP